MKNTSHILIYNAPTHTNCKKSKFIQLTFQSLLTWGLLFPKIQVVFLTFSLIKLLFLSGCDSPKNCYHALDRLAHHWRTSEVSKKILHNPALYLNGLRSYRPSNLETQKNAKKDHFFARPVHTYIVTNLFIVYIPITVP